MRLLLFTILMTIYALRSSRVLGYQEQLEMVEEQVGRLDISIEVLDEVKIGEVQYNGSYCPDTRKVEVRKQMLGNNSFQNKYEYVVIHEICHHLEYKNNKDYPYIKRGFFRRGKLIVRNQRLNTHEEFADDCAHRFLYNDFLQKNFPKKRQRFQNNFTS